VHEGKNDGAVGIFIGLSCELWGFFNCIRLHYATYFLLRLLYFILNFTVSELWSSDFQTWASSWDHSERFV